VPQIVLRRAFRAKFREKLTTLAATGPRLPAAANAVWEKDWGVHLRPFGSGERAIQYLGACVCRTAIGDSRIAGIPGIEGDKVTLTRRLRPPARGFAPALRAVRLASVLRFGSAGKTVRMAARHAPKPCQELKHRRVGGVWALSINSRISTKAAMLPFGALRCY
jgi:hypothetical protein